MSYKTAIQITGIGLTLLFVLHFSNMFAGVVVLSHGLGASHDSLQIALDIRQKVPVIYSGQVNQQTM